VTYEQLLDRAPKSSQIGDTVAAQSYVELLRSTDTTTFTTSQKLYIYRLLRKWMKRATVVGAWLPPGRPMRETTTGESRSIAAKAMRRHEHENESPLLRTIMQKYGKPKEDEFRLLKTPKKQS
jgi:hypothetical protein